MNRFEGVLGIQVSSMLDGIDRDLAERKRTTLQETERNAQLLLRLTRRRCRQRGQRAVAEERARMAQALVRTEAALASRRRRRQQAIDAGRLARGLDWLRAALLSRWADPATRQEWLETAVRQAATVLAADGWDVEFPDGLDEASVLPILETRATGATLVASADVDAGIRIRRGSACLDMTIDGLLANDSTLPGELLHDLYKLQQDDGDHHHG